MVLWITTAHCFKSYIILLPFIMLITVCRSWKSHCWKNHRSYHHRGEVLSIRKSWSYTVVWSQYFNFHCQKRMCISHNFNLSEKEYLFQGINFPCFKNEMFAVRKPCSQVHASHVPDSQNILDLPLRCFTPFRTELSKVCLERPGVSSLIIQPDDISAHKACYLTPKTLWTWWIVKEKCYQVT